MATDKHSWNNNSPFEASAFSLTDWRSSAEKLLGDVDFNDALVSDTADSIEIQPLYLQHKNAPFYSRGKHDWEICQTYTGDNIEQVNQQILSDLTEGISTVELTLSSQSASSLTCNTVTDLERLLKGVHPQMIKLSLTPAADNALHGTLLLAYYYRHKLVTEHINCAFNIDPIGHQARTGLSASSPLQQIDTIVEHCASHYTNVSSLCADSSVYHNAGSTEAQELAFLLATTVDYLRAITTVDIEAAFKQLQFRLALDSDYFLSIAKLRAARELLGQIARSCGASAPQIAIDTVTGTRSMAALDTSVNILRTSTQAAAAMAGGASGYLCEAYDSLAENSSTARRLARNTHHILKEESGLLAINDPTRGSGYIESLTEGLCSSAWQLFQKIEAQGGMLKSLESGFIQQQIASARSKREHAIATGDKTIIGVSQYPNLQEQTVAADGEQTTKPKLQNDETVAPPPSITAFVGVLADGEDISNFQSQTNTVQSSEPLTPYRDSLAYEQLRHRSNVFLESNGNRPTVSLLTFGTKKDYSARFKFCTDFFASAGIETTVNAIEDKPKLSAPLAVLCSSDKLYLSDAQTFSNALDHSTIDNVWLAGNNPKVISVLKNNIKDTIHLQCDRIKLLNEALTLLGAHQP